MNTRRLWEYVRTGRKTVLQVASFVIISPLLPAVGIMWLVFYAETKEAKNAIQCVAAIGQYQ